MFKMTHHIKRWRERGNIFFTLFAAVGVVGAIGVGSVTLLQGPVQTMVRANQQSIIQDYAELNTRIMINAVLQDTVTGPDCDGDLTIEAVPWNPPSGLPAPTGGGLFPDAYGTNITDPWGSRIGYCVWDHGTVVHDNVTDFGCGTTPNFLEGGAVTNEPFIAIISPGANKTFETSCIDFSAADLDDNVGGMVPDGDLEDDGDLPLITRVSGSDDQIIAYTYRDVQETMGDSWVFSSNDPQNDDAAFTDKNLEFSQDVTFNGLLDLSALGGGLTLPDIAGGTPCNLNNQWDLFRDSASNPPAVVMCDGTSFLAIGGGAPPTDTVIPDPNFDPEAANCIVNTGGPFVQAGFQPIPGTFGSTELWTDNGYIYNAYAEDGLYVYTFNGTTFTEVESINPSYVVNGVWGDGNYIYTANKFDGISAHSFDGTTLTEIDNDNAPDRTNSVWGDGTYIYGPDRATGLTAYSFDGTTITELATYDTPDLAREVWSDGTYIYIADQGDDLIAVTFDGTSFTLAGTLDLTGTGGVWGDGNYIYVPRNATGLSAYTFDGTTFTHVATYDTPGQAREVWGDGTHLFVADDTNGVVALTFDGTSFTLVDTFGTSDATEIWGDGRFIYVVDGLGGTYAFSGFECTSAANNIERTYEGNRGIDYNYRAYAWGRDLNGSLGNGGVSDEHQNVPMPIINHNSFYKISMDRWGSNNSACGIKTDGTAYCWGTNGRGLLGLGFEDAGTQAPDQPVMGGHKFKAIEGNLFARCGLTIDGRVLCWARGNEVRLGDGPATSNWYIPTQVDSPHEDFIDLAAANGSFCALRPNGDTYCWGVDQNGQLGNGSNNTADVDRPEKVLTNTKFVDIEGGEDKRYCGLTATGEAWCWGNNAGLSGISVIGNGSDPVANPDIHVPVKVSVIDDFVDIAVGSNHNCGVRVNGEMWCWGEDDRGQLGNGSGITHSALPTRVQNIDDFIKVTVKGSGTCGVTSDGLGYCWGNDSNGSNGTGGAGTTHVPAQISNITNFVDIDCNGQACLGIKKLTRAAADSGQTEPVMIHQSRPSGNTMGSHGLAINLNSTTINQEAGIGLAQENAALTGGDRYEGYIGARRTGLSTSHEGALVFKTFDGGNNPEMTLSRTGGLMIGSSSNTSTDEVRLAIDDNDINWLNKNYYDGLLIRSNPAGMDSAAYFGLNSQTGYNTILSAVGLAIRHTDATGSTVTTVADFYPGANVPRFYGFMNMHKNAGNLNIESYANNWDLYPAYVFFRDKTGGTGTPATAVASGDELGSIIFNAHDGTDYSTDGYAGIKAVVDGAVSSADVPTDLLITHPDGTARGQDYLEIDSTGVVNVGAATTTSGQINVSGRGAADEAIKPGLDINCSNADDEGTIRIEDNEYQYCDGNKWISLVDDKACVDEAVFINASTTRNGSCATMSNGQSVCWGSNGQNLVGNGLTTSPMLELRPIKTHKAVKTARGINSAYALTRDGRIKAWGNSGTAGRLGNGQTTDSAYPIYIASNHKYKDVVGANGHACGVRSDGDVDCWGSGNKLGYGSATNSRIPVEVLNVRNVVDISAGDSFTCAVTAEGTVWCWGENDFGQLGLGTETTEELIPQEVSGLTDVVDVAASHYYAGTAGGACALRRDGTVWCWGDNEDGQIGNGTSGVANVTTPTQVSGITNAIAVSAGSRSRYALLEDGTVRGWGAGVNGRLGNGSGSDQTTPVSVTGISTAVKLAESSSGGTMCAILQDGSMQCWGQNDSGQVGDGTTTNATTPVDVVNPLSCNSDKFVFATSTRYDGNLGGVAGANAICQKHADGANLPGRYLAWISDNLGNSPYENFNRLSDSYDYVRVGGTKHSDGWNDMIDGDIDFQLSVDEFGNTTAPSVLALTGTTESGDSTGTNCLNWTNSSSTIEATRGNGGFTGSPWTNDINDRCDFTYRLYCFQQ